MCWTEGVVAKMNCRLTAPAWLAILGPDEYFRSWYSCSSDKDKSLMKPPRCCSWHPDCTSRPAGLWVERCWRQHHSLRGPFPRSSGYVRRVGAEKRVPGCADPSLLRVTGKDLSQTNRFCETAIASHGRHATSNTNSDKRGCPTLRAQEADRRQ